ncbi:MAG: hypothetical protein HY519_04000 [Candidatus Aenigmarchaeota archaeon]|nr:hypothetical protein [Candidatus Aenigmarchaeota archaeon]
MGPGSAVNVTMEESKIVLQKLQMDPIEVFKEIAKKGPTKSAIDSDQDYDEMMEGRWKKRRT